MLLRTEGFRIHDLLLPYSIELSIFGDIDDSDVLNYIRRVGAIFYEKVASRAILPSLKPAALQ